MNRNAILGPDHLAVRELRQQCEWNTWPHASCVREAEGGRREEGGKGRKERGGREGEEGERREGRGGRREEGGGRYTHKSLHVKQIVLLLVLDSCVCCFSTQPSSLSCVSCLPVCWVHRRDPLCSRSCTCHQHPASACPSWRCLHPRVGCNRGGMADTPPPPSHPHTGGRRGGSSHTQGQLSPASHVRRGREEGEGGGGRGREEGEGGGERGIYSMYRD